MDKRKIVLLTFLLCACESKRSYACVKEIDNNQIYLDIEAINDEIVCLEVSEYFKLPYELLLNENRLNDFKKQLDYTYSIEESMLTHKYQIVPEERYSVSKTLKYLKTERFICE